MPNVYFGSRGQDVRVVQDCLNYHIRRAEPLVVDGVFGSKTDARVRRFQASNGLVPDGVVGPKTRAVLFETTLLRLTVVVVPRLELTLPGVQLPSFSGAPSFPQLQLPGAPVSGYPLPDPLDVPRDLLPGPSFWLRQASTASLPAAHPVATALDLTVRLPTRKDPTDPTVAARKQAIEFIDRLPKDFPFRAILLSKIPSTEIQPPTPGFGWGLSPLFKPDSGFGASGSTSFSVEVTGGNADLPTIIVGAWGEGKAFLHLAGRHARTGIRVELDGKMWLGAKGTF